MSVQVVRGAGTGPGGSCGPSGLRVWEVRLDRPRAANALSAALVEQLHAVLDDVVREAPDVVVLRGNERHFAAGLDLAGLPDESDATLAHRFLRIGLLLERWQTLPCLTVAVVRGHAVGAGADLALACDHRIGTPTARMRFPGPRFGVVLGTQRLVALAGTDAARQAVAGAGFDAVEAHARGLLTEVSGGAEGPDGPDPAVARAVEAWAGVAPEARRPLLAQLRPPTDDAALAALARSVAVPGLRDRVAAHAGNVSTHQEER